MDELSHNNNVKKLPRITTRHIVALNNKKGLKHVKLSFINGKKVFNDGIPFTPVKQRQNVVDVILGDLYFPTPDSDYAKAFKAGVSDMIEKGNLLYESKKLGEFFKTTINKKTQYFRLVKVFEDESVFDKFKKFPPKFLYAKVDQLGTSDKGGNRVLELLSNVDVDNGKLIVTSEIKGNQVNYGSQTSREDAIEIISMILQDQFMSSSAIDNISSSEPHQKHDGDSLNDDATNSDDNNDVDDPAHDTDEDTGETCSFSSSK
jgi:hypothetical protein